MARAAPDRDLVPSVLDRLIDREPRVSTEPVGRAATRVADLKEAVKRDLEWLLNARRTIVAAPKALPHLRRSLLTYGLPDFSHQSMMNALEQADLRAAVEAIIRDFEPRLLAVTVTPVFGEGHGRGVRFRIEGLLNVEPTPEAVSFDSELQPVTKAFVVQGD